MANSEDALGLLDVVDSLVADRIVWALGGEYGALALRATSREFRALIRAPQRVCDVREIARIYAKFGNIDACARLLARGRGLVSIHHIIASTAGEYGHDMLCKFMIDRSDTQVGNYESAQAAIGGAALGGHRELCEHIVEWIIARDVWQTMGKHDRSWYFEAMMVGAIQGNHADLFELSWVWSARYAEQMPHLSHALFTSISLCRTTMSKIIYERTSAERPCDAVSTLITAAQYGEVAMCKYLKPLARYKAREILREAIKHDSSTTGELARGWLREEDPREYPDAIADTLRVAITWSVYSIIVMVHGWLVEARGREMSLDELCAVSIDAASREDPNICAFFYEKMHATTGAERAIIAQTIEKMMKHAVKENCIETCELIHSWGARDYAAYLAEADRIDYAYAGSRDDMTRQIRACISRWISED